MPKKLNPDSTAAMNTVKLYSLLLFTGQAFSLNQLAEKFQCKKQSILRYIENLELIPGIQLESETIKRQRWVSLKPQSEMKTITLTPDMIQQLILCRDFVWNLLPQALQEDVSHTIEQTSKLVHDFNGNHPAGASGTASHTKGMIDYTGKEAIIKDILTALNEKKLCQFTYRSGAKKTSTLKMLPLKMIAHRDGLYLRCCFTDKGQHELLLAVHRIQSLRLLKEKAPLAAANSEKKGPMTFGIFPGKPFRVKVRISKNAAAYVTERIWSDDQVIIEEKGGGIVLEFTATSEREVISWVLGFGAEAELVAPDRLKKSIFDTIKKMPIPYKNR